MITILFLSLLLSAMVGFWWLLYALGLLWVVLGTGLATLTLWTVFVRIHARQRE
jgi:phosphatidylglycerophosphate synthase